MRTTTTAVLCALTLAVSAFSQEGVNPSATLSWYNTTYHHQQISGFSLPTGLCYDGTVVWVANSDTSAPFVSRVLNGVVTNTVPLPGAGDDLTAVACDPVDGIVFVADGINNVVWTVSTSTLTVSSFAVGAFPTSIVFDGTNIWVAQNGVSTIGEYTVTGSPIGTLSHAGVLPHTLFIDNQNQIWATTLNTAGVGVWTLGGTFKALVALPSATESTGIGFDGATMWAVGGTYGVQYSIYPINPTTYHVGTPISISSSAGTSSLAVIPGTGIWVAETGGFSGSVNLYSFSGGLITSFTLTGEPISISYAGSRLFVGNLLGSQITRVY